MRTPVLAGVGVVSFALIGVLLATGSRTPSSIPGEMTGADRGKGIVASKGEAQADLVAGPADLAAALEGIYAQLEQQRLAQKNLSLAVAEIERRLEIGASAAEGSGLESDAIVAAVDSNNRLSQDASRDPTDAAARYEQRRIQLLDAGFSEAETGEIIRLVDENTLKRLNLRYQAARDRGEAGVSDFRAQMRELPSNRELVREQFGEAAYDQYLYATGQANRVLVQGVLESSAAQQAGLQGGDTLLRLDDEPVYALRDLMRIGAAGPESEAVTLSVLRDGEVIEVSVPRGPLGINASTGSVNPGAPPPG